MNLEETLADLKARDINTDEICKSIKYRGDKISRTTLYKIINEGNEYRKADLLKAIKEVYYPESVEEKEPDYQKMMIELQKKDIAELKAIIAQKEKAIERLTDTLIKIATKESPPDT